MEGLIYCIGTLDSKGDEISFISKKIQETLKQILQPSQKIKLITVDVSTTSRTQTKSSGVDVVSQEVVLSYHPDPTFKTVSQLPQDRGAAISVMSSALESYMKETVQSKNVVGALGLGGSGGTSLISPALRSLRLGVPKMIVSTVASGNTSLYVGSTDLILVPSVVDIAGLNSVSMTIFSNAAAAFAGMVAGHVMKPVTATGARPKVGVTMFGVTTPCVTAVREKLEEKGYEVLVFHATGAGGSAMESLVAQGVLQAVLDLTTTEVADHVVGGVMACDDNRFMSTLERRLPLVLSVGALDMVNFGSKDTVPAVFSERKLHFHNNQVTLMRTTPDENRKFAKFIAERLNKSSAPVRILFPEKGVSALDAEGKPFHSPEATAALLDELQSSIHQTSDRQIRTLPCNINDVEFSNAVVEAFLEIAPVPEEPEHVTSESIKQKSVPECKPVPPVRSDAKPETVLARQKVLAALRKQISEGVPVIGAGAGTGISAKFEEEGGVDLIVIYNSGRFRMAGRGSLAGLLPFKDANAVVVDMANEVLPVVKRTPVLAGVCATDPFRKMSKFLRELEHIGFVGVQNFPTVGLFDGNFRQNLEETGMGFSLEVEMIREAHELGLLTTPYAFNAEESRAMAEAGADIIVAHMGLTTSGSIGAASSLNLDQSVVLVQEIADAALHVNPDVIVLCHGGPIAGPEDAEYVLSRTKGVHGFYGASSMERLPVEVAITETVRKYKMIKS